MDCSVQANVRCQNNGDMTGDRNFYYFSKSQELICDLFSYLTVS